MNEEGTVGETPLHLSTLLPEQKALPLLSLLLKNGADPRKKTSVVFPHSSAKHVHSSKMSHSTALEWAIEMDKKSLVEKLLEHEKLYDSRVHRILLNSNEL